MIYKRSVAGRWPALSLSLLLSVLLTIFSPTASLANTPLIKPVKLLQVPNDSLQQYDSFIAQVEPSQRAQLAFRLSGEILNFNVRMGSKVNAGELLVELDDSDYQLNVDAKEAQFQLQKLKLQRAQALYEKRLISSDDFDQTNTAFKTAQANLEQAQTELSYTQLYAPFTGLVSLTNAKKYQYVNAQQVVLNLQNNQQFDVTFSLPIPMAQRINSAYLKSQPVWLVLDNFRQHQLSVNFKEITTDPSSETNSYKVTMLINKPEQLNIISGMSGKILVAKNAPNTRLQLPDGAIISKRDGSAKVWLWQPDTGTIDAITVQIDERNRVLSGLNSGDWIVSAGAQDLSQGQAVRAWEREGGI